MADHKTAIEESIGRYAYEGLERVFHEKARLGIMTSLISQPRGVIFSDLKELCHLTDGNLSRHLQVLYEAGLVEIWKGFHKKRPQTLCRVTDEGRRRFFEYINVLETVVKDAAQAAQLDRGLQREHRRRLVASLNLIVRIAPFKGVALPHVFTLRSKVAGVMVVAAGELSGKRELALGR